MSTKINDIKKVVVTGASGAVGRCILRNLLSEGIEVRAVDIRSPGDDILSMPGISFVQGDLTDSAFASSIASGMDAVIHTAALVDIGLDYEALYPLNVEAVCNLYIAAAKAGARRFVHFSSGSVYGPGAGGVVDEDTPLVAKSPYERTKIESEEAIAELYHDMGLEWIVLRPSLIYGPGARFLAAGAAAIPPVLRWVLGEKVPGFKGGPRTNLVHAEDVARAAIFLMRNAAPLRAYNVADTTPLDAGAILTAAIRAWGIEPAFMIPIPEPESMRPLRSILDSDAFFDAINAPIGPGWKRLAEEHGLEPGLHLSVDRGSAPYLFQDTVFSVDRLRVRGFTWKHPDFSKSIASVLRWYEDHRWIPRIQDVEPGGGRTPHVGFSFTETMAGEVDLVDEGRREGGRPFVFTVTAKALRIDRFLQDAETRIDGILCWDGIADGVPIQGSLRMPLLSRRQLHYDFTFKADDGETYRFTGRKDVDVLRPLESMTTLPGQVLDSSGDEVASGVARFNLGRDLLPMVASFSLI